MAALIGSSLALPSGTGQPAQWLVIIGCITLRLPTLLDSCFNLASIPVSTVWMLTPASPRRSYTSVSFFDSQLVRLGALCHYYARPF